MNSQDHSAQNSGQTSNDTNLKSIPSTIQFKHRENTCFDGSFFNLIDTLLPSLKRAEAIAEVLEIACLHDEGLLSDTITYFVAQAIRYEIQDTKVLLDAFDEVQKQANRSAASATNSQGGEA